MSSSVKTSYPLYINPHSIEIGENHIPIGNVREARVQEDNTVRLWCRKPMGMPGDGVLDFQLQDPEKVSEFVKGILDKTKAYLIAIASLKVQVKPALEGAYVKANFGFHTHEDAKIFQTHVAPIYFSAGQIKLSERTVTVISEKGNKEEVVSRMKRAFASLNTHTQNTLNEALSFSREFHSHSRQSYLIDCVHNPNHRISTDRVLIELEKNRSYVSWNPMQPPYFSHHIDSPHYVVSPSKVQVMVKQGSKYVEKPLVGDPEGIKKTVALIKRTEKELNSLIDSDKDFSNFLHLISITTPIFDLFNSIIANENSLTEIDIAVFSNRLNALKFNLKSLDPVIQEGFQKAMSILQEGGEKAVEEEKKHW